MSKEGRQVIRDPSSIAIGVVLPVMLILLFGYGLSLDVMNVPVAVVLEDTSPAAMELAAGFKLSPYFSAQLLTSMPEARELMLDRKVDGIVRIRPDFSRRLMLGDAEVQILVHGTDANRARIIQGYAEGAIGQWTARRSAEGKDVAAGPVVVQNRLWFNDANDSHYFLVPGLIVLIMTLIGALLTALVMAREWERGTLEALFVTPVRSGEILLGKTVPYFVLGMIGLALCIFAAQFLFDVPLRGSISGAARRLDALSARRARHRTVDLLGGQEPIRRQPGHAAGHIFAGGDALRVPLRHSQHAGRRCARLPTSCRPAISWPCCKPCFWPATSGASSCRTRRCWP